VVVAVAVAALASSALVVVERAYAKDHSGMVLEDALTHSCSSPYCHLLGQEWEAVFVSVA
jgi:hypothetical protein